MMRALAGAAVGAPVPRLATGAFDGSGTPHVGTTASIGQSPVT